MWCFDIDAYNILEGYCFIAVIYSLYGMNRKEKSFASIIRKLNNRTLTGQGLGISIHRHEGFEFHFAWNAGAERGSYYKCIVRQCQEVPLFYEILLRVRSSNLVGLCKCLWGTAVGHKSATTVCYYTEHNKFSCRCRIDSVVQISEK